MKIATRQLDAPPIGVRWIDHNKGDAQRPNVRCRLVAQDFKTEKNDDLFAGTPPLEALKLVLSRAVSGSKTRCVMVNDISRAYLHAPCRGDVFVARCAETELQEKTWKRRLVGHS